MPLVLTSPRCLLLYRLRTSWLHQHLFFFLYPGGNYKLLTTFPRSSLLFIKRRNLEIIVRGCKTSQLRAAECVLTRPVSSEHRWERVPGHNPSRLPKLWLRGWREMGRTEEKVRWSGPPLQQCLLCFISHEVTSFSSTEKCSPSPVPLRIGAGHCFLPSIRVLYSKDTLVLAQMLAEGSFSRPELGRKGGPAFGETSAVWNSYEWWRESFIRNVFVFLAIIRVEFRGNVVPG